MNGLKCIGLEDGEEEEEKMEQDEEKNM